MDLYGFDGRKSDLPGEKFGMFISIPNNPGAIEGGYNTQVLDPMKDELLDAIQNLAGGIGFNNPPQEVEQLKKARLDDLQNRANQALTTRRNQLASPPAGTTREQLESEIAEIEDQLKAFRDARRRVEGEERKSKRGNTARIAAYMKTQLEQMPGVTIQSAEAGEPGGLSGIRQAAEEFGATADAVRYATSATHGLTDEGQFMFAQHGHSYNRIQGFGGSLDPAGGLGGFYGIEGGVLGSFNTPGFGYGAGGPGYGYGGFDVLFDVGPTFHSGSLMDDIRRDNRRLEALINFLIAQILMGNIDAITSALIAISRKSKGTLIRSSVAMLQAMQQYDKQQDALTDQFAKLTFNPNNPQSATRFQHESQALSMKINSIAVARQMFMNQLRDVMTMSEEIGNVEKSILDITGQYKRSYSRFNV